jgi:hypothetical protein
MAALVGLAVTMTLVTSCGGDDPAGRATTSARELVADFVGGKHDGVCRQLSQRGKDSVVAAALKKGDRRARLGDCFAASRFLLDGTPAGGRQALEVDDEPTDVDLLPDGARVRWEDCCTFTLEEVGDDYRVSEASDLGLYFDVAGAGAGAGSGSPPATPTREVKERIEANFRAVAESFPDQRFREHVTEIQVAGPRVTLVTDLPITESKVVGVCRAASGGQESDPVADLPGVSQLLVRTSDGATEDCINLLAPV